MQPGEIVGDRFLIERQSGKGGMATVFYAIDLQHRTPVALKFLDSGAWASQFIREAELLSSLHHPAIVQYLTHGRTTRGELYLAMEWLEGEDLSKRLSREGLSVAESIALLRRIAEALAVTHDRGIIHRDIKPSNLFLPNGRVEDAKILDFGIALLTEGDYTRTPTGIRIGTPGYMSPERARGDKDIDARADVFSLGCVLFECLTGHPAFSGEHTMAVLSKILLEERRPAKLQAGLPRALDGLLSAMLAKDPSARPQDASAVVAALSTPELTEAQGLPAPAVRSYKKLSTKERQLLCAVIAPSSCGPIPIEIINRYGGRLTHTDDSMLVSIKRLPHETAIDQATRAAHCALALTEALPVTSLALTTAWGDPHSLPPNDDLDNGSRLLARADQEKRIWLEPLIAGLLESHFQINAAELFLGSELVESRMLLGRSTETVGRERELSRIIEIIDECIENSAPRALLLHAPSGVGKSRLCREVINALGSRSEPMKILACRCDPMQMSSPLALINQILKQYPASEFINHESGERAAEALYQMIVAECAHRPVLLVLEDLHWSDAPSVHLIDTLLQRLVDAPFTILALARPEVHERFSGLWANRGLLEIELRDLSKKTSLLLIQQSLGGSLPKETEERICDLAGGNALYLEELLRSYANGEHDTPATVLAMMQSSIDCLPAASRRVLRAASIFGETFCREGIVALLGDISTTLDELCAQKLLVPCGSGQRDYKFRQELLREAAYAMLTEEDRSLGHQLAAEWLLSVKETDVQNIAEHFEQGEAFSLAAEYYEQAAERSQAAGTKIELAEKALVLDPSREERGTLQQIISEARFWLCEPAQSQRWGMDAMICLASGCPLWCRAAAFVALASGETGDQEQLSSIDAQLQPLDTQSPTSHQLYTWAALANAYFFGGYDQHALALLEKLERSGADEPLHLKAYRALHQKDLNAFAALCKEAEDSVRHEARVTIEEAHKHILLLKSSRMPEYARVLALALTWHKRKH